MREYRLKCVHARCNCVCVWPEDSPGVLVLTFPSCFEMGSVPFWVNRVSWPFSFEDTPVSTSHFHSEQRFLMLALLSPALMWALGIQTQIIRHVW